MESPTDSNVVRLEADKADKRRLRMLWIGVCIYTLIIVNGVRLLTQPPYLLKQVPYQALVVGGVMNLAILMSTFVAIGKVQRRMRERKHSVEKAHGGFRDSNTF